MLSDVGELDVGFLGQASEHVEGGDVVDVVAFHDDAFGLADAVACGQGCLHLLVVLAGEDGGRGVGGEHGADGFRFGGPGVGSETEEVERPAVRSAV